MAEVSVTTKNPVQPMGVSELKWKKKDPEGITIDARGGEPRMQPVLNAGFQLRDIDSLFHFLFPELWSWRNIKT
ncbi:hypothetical protein AB1Y20_004283 [Prymnesium parvum]|uniref:Uncharacterized protein n=1 Tax=Prymnesium parvum TaxID=97485 RepID=A0AB34IVW8_PRYPA